MKRIRLGRTVISPLWQVLIMFSLNIYLYFCLISISTAANFIPKLQRGVNPLNLQYDHCTKPMKFSWTTLQCECPEPFVRIETDCFCENCVYYSEDQRYVEKNSASLPSYLNDAIKELDEDSSSLSSSQAFNKTNDSDGKLERTKRHLSTKFYRLSHKPLDRSEMKLYKLVKRHKEAAQPVLASFSQNVIANETSGEAVKGQDLAKGSISSYRGTGSISLATGGGAGGSAAITGPGNTVINTKSEGAFAYGKTVIGKKAEHASTTSVVLIGKGDAIAENALGKKGSASGSAVSTLETAATSSAAYGPASVSASATPGAGDASGNAFLGNGTLGSVAKVQTEGGAVAESSAVGNPEQDIKNLNNIWRSKKPSLVPDNREISADWEEFVVGEESNELAPRIFSMIRGNTRGILRHLKKG